MTNTSSFLLITTEGQTQNHKVTPTHSNTRQIRNMTRYRDVQHENAMQIRAGNTEKKSRSKE